MEAQKDMQKKKKTTRKRESERDSEKMKEGGLVVTEQGAMPNSS